MNIKIKLVKNKLTKIISAVGLCVLVIGVLEANHLNNNQGSPNNNNGPNTQGGQNGQGLNGPGQNGQNGNIALTPNQNLDPQLVALGNNLFFDTALSTPVGQSCATCHDASVAFTDPNKAIPTSQGVITDRFGNRNAPTVTYAATIPPFQFARNNRRFRGGLFLDGRADDLEEQAIAPFFNPLEMNNADTAELTTKVINSSYADEFITIFGDDAFDNSEQLLGYIAQAIAEFERSETFNPFSSKFDAVQLEQQSFSESEERGRQLFFGRARCDNCHRTRGSTGIQVFSDFSYANTGVPANSNNPFYNVAAEFNSDGVNFIDHGLGNSTGLASQNGKFRVPSLRNIALTSPYMHNGVFDSLEEVVEFYNSRESEDAEVTENISNRGRIGNLQMSTQDITDLVAFLNTLTDGAF